jgi:uncharacterized protein
MLASIGNTLGIARRNSRFVRDPSAPGHPDVHLVDTSAGCYAFIVSGSQIYELEAEAAEALRKALTSEDRQAVDRLIAQFEIAVSPLIDDRPPVLPALRSISLAIAQKCNLGCTYCYAQQGSFGGRAKAMSAETAFRAVELLFQQAEAGIRVNVAFLGGEPLANRPVLRAATKYAAELAKEHAVDIGFSITTNGTLLTEQDAIFFERHRFAVTVSLDGLRHIHDRDRSFKHGGGSFDCIMARVRPLLDQQRNMQVSVRATVTPGNLKLKDSLDFFLEQGFHSVGFSPMLRSPSGQGELATNDFAELLKAMMECGAEFERRVGAGGRYAFSNIVNAMRELHRGTHRPYPCGAGAGYLGVSAEGELAACHRFVGDEKGAMGDLLAGIDRERQNRWLADRHVHRQEPCMNCWARYLCGGGCHHEVIARGRPACDYIRGWLHYCLEVYARLSRLRPDYFSGQL